MKKIAIVTITNSGLNFGNRLQNYALQHQLEKCGASVETIISSNNCFNSLLLSKLRRMIKKIVKTSKRRRYFNKFNKSNMKCCNTIHYERLNDEAYKEMYDAFIAGSDQIWNPYFHFNSDFEFLSFADKSKRFSYAASIGVDQIDEKYHSTYKELLSDMRTISVREFSSINLVKDLCGRDAYVHVDPTMLLTKEEYYEIMEESPIELPEHYLLVYYLGNVSEEYRLKIKEYSQYLNLEIVELSESVGTKYYGLGPQHFLYIFAHADYVCTDSFHGSVFSIIFEKRFTIFIRQDKDVPMNARIETLIEKMGLQERLIGALSLEESCKEIDYTIIRGKIKTECEKSIKYLNEICNR